MIQVIHNSHDSFFRKPFGAAPCETEVQLRLEVYHSEHQNVACILQLHEGVNAKQLEMKQEKKEEGKSIYTVQYRTPQNAMVVWYYFKIQINDEIMYYGNNWDRLGGEGVISNDYIPAYQITVYENNREVPKWFKQSIMYQIFPDRYFNGNEDQKIENAKLGSLIHGQWHDTPYYIKDSQGRVVRWDFFGGNLKGIQKKLSYLKELGIDVIYLNPIFEAASNHRYDTGDYKKIDPMLGSTKDFENLMNKGKELDIRFILDGVFSHTGSESLYFNKGGKYQGTGAYQSKASPYYSWYKFTKHPDEYESWWGVGTLPNVNELEPTYQDFIYNDEDSVLKHWIKKGAKGWRLDVADELPDAFIKNMKREMIVTDEKAVLIGEVWEDASNKVSYNVLREYLLGRELDSVMNYPFRGILIDFALGHISGEMAYKKLMSLYENYPEDHFYALMNLIGTHDVERILTILGEAENGANLTEEQKEIYRLPQDKKRLGIKRLKILSLIQMTFPGVPCIYYGDEAGMEGYADPYNRGPYPWGKEDKDIIDWYKKVIKIRKDYPLFVEGNWSYFFCNEDIFGYWRSTKKHRAICIFNRNCEKSFNIPIKDQWHQGRDLLSDKELKDINEIYLKPLEGRIILVNV